MKKGVAFILIAVARLSLVGCDKSEAVLSAAAMNLFHILTGKCRW